MFRLEIKRLLKTRSVAVLAALALAASAFFAASTVFDDGMSVESRAYYDPSLKGLNAIEYLKGIYDGVEGYVTEERIDEAHRVSDEIWETYRSFDVMPKEAFDQYVAWQAILNRIGYQDSDYYEQRRENIESGLFTQNQAVTKAATELDSSVNKPFYWEYGFGSSDMGQQWTICLFALCLICTVIAVPIFSQGYATGEDSILRCSKYGRRKLARTRMLAVYAFCTALYIICAAVFSGILLLALGPDKSSAQLKVGSYVLINLNMNQALALFVLSGLLTMLASTSLTMWLSSIQSNTVMVLVMSAAALALPMFADHYLNYPVSDWIRLLLPGGGTGLQNSMYYELASGFQFLTLGSLAIWTPFVMLAAPVIETPVFALLARRAYVRHEG